MSIPKQSAASLVLLRQVQKEIAGMRKTSSQLLRSAKNVVHFRETHPAYQRLPSVEILHLLNGLNQMEQKARHVTMDLQSACQAYKDEAEEHTFLTHHHWHNSS